MGLAAISILRLQRPGKAGPGHLFLMFIFTVSGTHALIVSSWWLIFRWILFPANPALITSLAWILSLLFICIIHRKGWGVNVDAKTLLIRMPPVLLFFILYLKSPPDTFHSAYAVAFAFSYLFLLFKISRRTVARRSFDTTLPL